MASDLDTLLEPGETVLWRHRTSVRQRLLFALFFVSAFSAGMFAFYAWMDSLGREFGPPNYLAPVFMIVMIFAVILSLRFEGIVTERRLLLRHRLFLCNFHTVVVLLSDIAAVRGLAPQDGAALVVETIDGKFHSLGDLPQPHAFARALAKSVGLPVPPAVPPLVERVARFVLAANTCGLVLGGVYVPLAALIVTFKQIDPDNITVLSFIAVGLSVSMFVPVVLGLALGWLTGNLLAFAYLRPLITARELGAALQLLHSERVRMRLYYRFAWTEPLHSRLAGWVYGERMGAEEPTDGADGAEANGA